MSIYHYKYKKYKQKYLQLSNKHNALIGGNTNDNKFTITSPLFKNGEQIPIEYTCDNSNGTKFDNIVPLEWSNIPENTKSLALIIDDPDAPKTTWVHFVCWNINRNATKFDINNVKIGVNSWNKNNYGNPCPPVNHGTHRYYFKLYALDNKLSFNTDKVTKEMLLNEINKHKIAKTQLMGTFQR